MNRNSISRRKFAKTAGLAGCLPLAMPLHTSSDRKPKVPEEEKKICFLFQGDSITDGNRGRNEDPNHILGHGYAFSISSRIGADFPEAGFTFYNRGISGNTVRDLKGRWQQDTLDLNPGVLSILVGINDVAALVENKPFRQSVKNFETDYGEILQAVEKQQPRVLPVLGIPFVFPVAGRKENWDRWRDVTAEHAEAVRKIASDHQAVLVDYQQLFERATLHAPIDYWIWDGIHPTVFGHELMAREWIRQVSHRLHFLKYYKYPS